MTPPASRSKTSEQQTPAPEDTTTPPPPGETEEQRKAREEAAAKAAENQDKDNEKRKGNLAKVADVDTYNPYLDPDVPDSVLADTISVELKGGGESPTLQALREGKKEEEKNSEE